MQARYWGHCILALSQLEPKTQGVENLARLDTQVSISHFSVKGFVLLKLIIINLIKKRKAESCN